MYTPINPSFTALVKIFSQDEKLELQTAQPEEKGKSSAGCAWPSALLPTPSVPRGAQLNGFVCAAHGPKVCVPELAAPEQAWEHTLQLPVLLACGFGSGVALTQSPHLGPQVLCDTAWGPAALHVLLSSPVSC